MNTDSYIAPVWQLKVNAEGVVPMRSKYHCFVEDETLCFGHKQITSFYDDGITIKSDTALEQPDHVCKRCLSRWKRLYQVNK